MFLLSTICMVLEVVNTMGVLEGIKLETQGAFQPPTAWYGFRGANDRTLVQATIFSLEGLYPTAIILLIHRERSSWDSPEISTSLCTSFKAAAPPQYGPPMKQESKQISTLGIGTIDRSSIISITEPHIIKEVDNPKLAKSWSSHLSDIGPSSPNVKDNTSQISLALPLRSEPLALVDYTATHRAHGRSLSNETIAVTE
ncbi:hypothetical protein HHX47_DHR9000560 [Lentinula edodes]|nr:hypothetical protein HHX47_DHR9000560 [Lentinula edodes]